MLAVAFFALPAHAQTSGTFTAGSGTLDGNGGYDYSSAANWNGDAVPTLATGGLALINDGDQVDYNSGNGDFIIANGGELEVSNGSWDQWNGGNWIQLGEGGGNGHILVNGGTFNQGTAGNNPFNTEGTGNTFTISSGSAAFNGGGVQVNAGLTWLQSGGNVTSAASLQVQGGTYTQSGGTVSFTGAGIAVAQNGAGSTWNQSGGTVSFTGNLQLNGTAAPNNLISTNFVMSGGTMNVGGEADFSNTTSSMTAGVMNITSLFTMVNGPTGSTFNFSGGLINDEATGFSGWYGPSSTSPFNFTVLSTGTLQFDGDTLGTVQGWVNAGDIAYEDTTDPTAFNVVNNAGDIDVSLISVPEPSTYALFGFGGLGMWFVVRRKKTRFLS